MKPKDPKGRKTRSYKSSLRDERAEQTRARILDGLVRVMARDGIAELSIPLVAKESGVSVPSVYRYFPTKRDLITALDEYAHKKGSFTLDEFGPMDTPDDLANIIPLTFKRREAIESTLSAAMNSRLGYTIRHQEFVERAKHFSKALQPVAKELNAHARMGCEMSGTSAISSAAAVVRQDRRVAWGKRSANFPPT